MDALDFEWDDENVDHLARHGITPDEVEEIFQGQVLRRRGGTEARDRYRVLGRTVSGRYLAVVYQLKPNGVMRAFTGWTMTVAERRLYERNVEE
jgi:uncharacterized DUF497 family protein